MGKVPTDGCGCSDSGAGVRIIEVGGHQIGISRLDSCFEAVRARRLETELQIKRELLRLVKAANYVPKGLEGPYQEALWREYQKAR